jgi:hypothetical protein
LAGFVSVIRVLGEWLSAKIQSKTAPGPQREARFPAAAEEAPHNRRAGVRQVSFQLQCPETLELSRFMVTTGMVNGPARNFSPPCFCVFFRDSGRNLDSWNPVNYHFVTRLSLAIP